MTSRRSPFLPVALLVLGAIAAVPLLTGDPSAREELFLIYMLITLASSVNVIMGYAGYVSFGNIVFFGLGGYFAFWLMNVAGVTFLLAAFLGAMPATAVALVIGIPVLKLRGAYFALATIGINEAVRVFMTNFEPFGGAVGMFFNFSIYAQYGGAKAAAELAYVFMIIVALATVATSYFIRTSRLGLSLMAIREDQDTATVLGIDPPRAKLVAYLASAFFPALAGAAFFFKNGIIEPSSAFDLTRSIESLVMVALGGIGTVTGPIIGAALYEGVRGFLITNPFLANLQLFLAGLLLLIVILFASGGLVGWALKRFPRLRSVVE